MRSRRGLVEAVCGLAALICSVAVGAGVSSSFLSPGTMIVSLLCIGAIVVRRLSGYCSDRSWFIGLLSRFTSEVSSSLHPGCLE